MQRLRPQNQLKRQRHSPRSLDSGFSLVRLKRIKKSLETFGLEWRLNLQALLDLLDRPEQANDGLRDLFAREAPWDTK